jgi:hypothetical protein
MTFQLCDFQNLNLVYAIEISRQQCWGSESVGSVCFWASRIRYRSIKYGFGSVSGSGSFYHYAKILRKPLIPVVLLFLFDVLSLNNDVNVPVASKVRNEKTLKKKKILVAILKVTDKNSSMRIGTPTKMSWIRTTGRQNI